MSPTRDYRPVVLIRWGLLAALALFLGGVVAIFINNTINRSGDADDGRGNEIDINLRRDILSGKGFDFEVTDGDQRLYHISASKILANRNDVVTLEDIRLSIERDSGSVYVIAAQKGIYRTKNGTAELDGGVVLTGPDGVELRGPKFDLLRKGSLVRSRGPVDFVSGDGLSGSAAELDAYLRKDRYQLSGRVQLESPGAQPGDNLSLQADRVIYEKGDNMVHAEGRVKLRQGASLVSCKRVAVTLADDGGSAARFVRARWNVSGTLVSRDPLGFDRQLDFVGEEISLAYGKRSGELKAAELDGSPEQPARLVARDDTGLARRFVSARIEARFARGEMREVRSAGAVVLTEYLVFDPARELGRLCGGLMVATFDKAGELVRLAFKKGADLHRSGIQTTGEVLTVLGKDVIKAEGSPANIYTPQGELGAPELTYSSARDDLVASGGVRAWLPPSSGMTMVKATRETDDLPIQVTSDAAEWGNAQRRFEFTGSVRAWQGESFLTAQRLIGENGERVRGEGGVQTTLERNQKEVSRERAEPPAVPDAGQAVEDSQPATASGENGPQGPVRITAESFEYDKAMNQITYRGDPEVRDSGRLMSCDELAVFLSPESDLERLECRGDALIDDRPSGQKVTGTIAIYRPEDAKVEFTGSPVVLQKPDGAVIRASSLLYDFETSSAQFLSASSRAAPEGSDGP